MGCSVHKQPVVAHQGMKLGGEGGLDWGRGGGGSACKILYIRWSEVLVRGLGWGAGGGWYPVGVTRPVGCGEFARLVGGFEVWEKV